nr:1-acyl-sn-glycerol-3-phosphate acyltransferase-like isoform X1 [Ipomoea batatas]
MQRRVEGMENLGAVKEEVKAEDDDDVYEEDDGWGSVLISWIRIVVCFVSMMLTTLIWALIMLLLLPWPYQRIRQGNIYGHVTEGTRSQKWALTGHSQKRQARFLNSSYFNTKIEFTQPEEFVELVAGICCTALETRLPISSSSQGLTWHGGKASLHVRPAPLNREASSSDHTDDWTADKTGDYVRLEKLGWTPIGRNKYTYSNGEEQRDPDMNLKMEANVIHSESRYSIALDPNQLQLSSSGCECLPAYCV